MGDRAKRDPSCLRALLQPCHKKCHEAATTLPKNAVPDDRQLVEVDAIVTRTLP
jgi:hypothetical protein